MAEEKEKDVKESDLCLIENGPSGANVSGKECLCCFSDLSEENYVAYQIFENSPWYLSLYCEDCIKQLLTQQWSQYLKYVGKPDCAAAFRRVLKLGVPLHFRDTIAVPVPENERTNPKDQHRRKGEAHSFWLSSSKSALDPKLNGVYLGEEREEFVKSLVTGLALMERVEADEDAHKA